MSRRSPVLAAVALSVAAAGLTLGGVATAHAATSTVPSIRVTAPCMGGGGTIAVRAYRTAEGGVGLSSRISGVAPGTRWQGLAYIGTKYSADITDPTKLPTITADENGVATDSFSVGLSWPRASGSIYFRSATGSAMCGADESLKNGRLTASGSATGIMLRPGTRTVRVGDFGGKPKSKWRVNVALTRASGTTHLTKVTTTDDSGTVDTRFTNVGRLRGVTRAAVRVVNVKTGKVHWLRVVRTP